MGDLPAHYVIEFSYDEHGNFVRHIIHEGEPIVQIITEDNTLVIVSAAEYLFWCMEQEHETA